VQADEPAHRPGRRPPSATSKVWPAWPGSHVAHSRPRSHMTPEPVAGPAAKFRARRALSRPFAAVFL